MGRNSCGVRMGMQKLVKVKGKVLQSQVIWDLLHTKAVKLVFIEAFNAFIQSDFQQSDHVKGGQCLVTEYP